MDLELADTDEMLAELAKRFNGVFFVGRTHGARDHDFRVFSRGGKVTDLLGMIEIGKRDLLDLDKEAEAAES